ncbi:hypothetical protein WJX81_004759 [Elliptochloris bilobata]|uniref:Hflx-type G domain-containing protein n=1 Tax=Elliptochloris bilobata TaxID=381761 RepID=A0AAW1RJM1_9CHLO
MQHTHSRFLLPHLCPPRALAQQRQGEKAHSRMLARRLQAHGSETLGEAPLPLEKDREEKPDWRTELSGLAATLRQDEGDGADELPEAELGVERAYLAGVQLKRHGNRDRFALSITDSLEELRRLAQTAGLQVVGQTFQALEAPHPRTYLGTGKLAELAAELGELKPDTVIFDDELTPGQLRNLEKQLAPCRVADRAALVIDIFSQAAKTKEGQLQVHLAQLDYQLPRLTRMWTHLERQAGGRTRGMGEKQIEVDKRLLRLRMAQLRRQIEEVRRHRKQYRERRADQLLPVISLVGYTNAGKSTLLNRLTAAGVLAEDKLFATLDPTTRRLSLPSGKEVLLTDTVGFIQKLPTQLIAAFQATLEEIESSTLLMHIVDVSHPNAPAQSASVLSVLAELGVDHLPLVTVWNKIDAVAAPETVRAVASAREGDGTVCISAATGEGMDGMLTLLDRYIATLLLPVRCMLPFSQGDLLAELRSSGVVTQLAWTEHGTLVEARVPPTLQGRVAQYAVEEEEFRDILDTATFVERPGAGTDTSV